MTAKRARVADVDDSLDELKRIIEALRRFEATLNAECQQRRRAPSKIFVGKGAVPVIFEPRIFDPFNSRIVAQGKRDSARVLCMAFNAQGKRLDALQNEKGVHWRKHGAGRALVDRAGPSEIRLSAESIDVDKSMIENRPAPRMREAVGAARANRSGRHRQSRRPSRRHVRP